ncbi:diguanylate cyclase [Natranaerofaba carboxydovora]|uniref:diguanylate cyclase n=1 Tax=Natranaerofaba carboxydovora TaxID=2742683 RepID=UPI001F14187C|nr:diguanylate cyclase [Natranaerofaba carboxydovora]UMZ73520.1 Cyclic di-GMP phosphodiesterase response regulator RpfG [Natranaerofaba carboxydovora]
MTYGDNYAELKAILNFLPDATFAIDTEGKVILWNQAMEDMTGIKAKDILGKGNYEYTIPFYGERRPMLVDMALNYDPEIENYYSNISLQDEHTLVGENFCPNVGESGIYAWAKASRLYDSDGNVIGAIESIRDIMDRVMAEENLRNTLSYLDDVIESLPDATLVIDTKGRVVYWNRAMEEMTGIKKENILGKGDYEYALPFYGERRPVLADLALIPSDSDQYKRLKENYDISYVEEDTLTGEVYCPETYGGRGAYLFATASKLRDTSGNIVGAIETIRDITERKQVEEKIKYLSFNDNLTGLYNRAYLEEEIKRLDTARQHPLCIIMADLNGLKLVNDTYGHDMGDEMLKCAANILKESCRKEDLIARWGGDEFVILLPKTSMDVAKMICERINKKCENSFVKDVPISIALGVSLKEEENKNFSAFLKEAEDNMYKQKLAESRSARSAVLNTLLKTLESKSFETEEHIKQMQEAALAIGKQLTLSEFDLNRLKLVVTLHDIGKINIPQEVLTKEGPLTKEEWEQMKEHPEIGYRIVRSTDEFSHVAEEILSHHEYWDGNGYPKGLKGDEIPLLARITSIADAYVVMKNGRPHKKPKSTKEIIAEFNRCSGSQFDPHLVDVFLDIIKGNELSYEG